MNYEFNNEYLAKSLMALVRDEGNRIISLGLSSRDNLKKLVESTLQVAVKRASENGPNILLKTLSELHNDLSSVKLPGDFKKIAMGMEDKILIVLDIPQEKDKEQIFDIPSLLNKEEEPRTKAETDKIKAETKEKKEEKEDDAIDMDAIKETIKCHIIPKLEKMAYDLGSKGEHKAAYTIERVLRDIERT